MKQNFILLFLLCLSLNVMGQTTITIVSSDRLKGQTGKEGFVRTLNGNVHLRTKDQNLFCDSAHQFVDKKLVLAFGNVHVIDEEQSVRSDFLKYNLQTEVAEFSGHVLIQNDSSVVQAPLSRYFYPTRTALFPEGVYLTDNQGIVVAEKAMYFTKIDSVILWGNVRVSSEDNFAKADSMLANRKTEQSRAYGNFEAITDKEFISSYYSYSDSSGFRHFFGNAFMQRIDSTKKDSLQVHADTIKVWTLTDSTADFTAQKEVSVWSPDYQTFSHDLVFTDSIQTFFLNQEPILWYDDIQITADSVRFLLEEKSPKDLFANDNLIIVQLDTATNRFNQILGDSMRLSFLDSEPKTMWVFGKTDIIYHSVDDNDEADGALSMKSTGLIVQFDSSQISQVKGVSNITGQYLNEDPSLATLKLPRFNWTPEIRLKKTSVTKIWPDLTLFDPKFYMYWKVDP